MVFAIAGTLLQEEVILLITSRVLLLDGRLVLG